MRQNPKTRQTSPRCDRYGVSVSELDIQFFKKFLPPRSLEHFVLFYSFQHDSICFGGLMQKQVVLNQVSGESGDGEVGRWETFSRDTCRKPGDNTT